MSSNKGNKEGMPSPERIIERLGEQQAETSIMPIHTRDIYFFAYDMLMDHTMVSRYTKGLVPFKAVRMVNHRLSWPWYYPPASTALPSVLRTNEPGDEVWGLLYNANNVAFKLLERHLKVPTRYYRKSVSVEDHGGRSYSAFAYALTLRSDEDLKPSAEFRDQLVEVARTNELPAQWIARLEALETG
jgi:hypothetical protein